MRRGSLIFGSVQERWIEFSFPIFYWTEYRKGNGKYGSIVTVSCSGRSLVIRLETQENILSVFLQYVYINKFIKMKNVVNLHINALIGRFRKITFLAIGNVWIDETSFNHIYLSRIWFNNCKKIGLYYKVFFKGGGAGYLML